jgi:hypothetical protein
MKTSQWGVGGIINPNPSVFTNVRNGQKTVSLQANLSPPQVCTVQFSITPLSQPNERENIPVAIIEFACNGCTVRRKISVYDGATISGPGEAIKVIASDESEDARRGPYAVNVTISIGTRAGFASPVLMNDPQAIVASTASHTFEIPQDVGAIGLRFQVAASTPTATIDPEKLVIEFIDSGGSTISAEQNPVTGFVQIPPGAVEVTLQNNDTNQVRARPVYQIDG